MKKILIISAIGLGGGVLAYAIKRFFFSDDVPNVQNRPDTMRKNGETWAVFNKNFGNIRNAGKRYKGEVTASLNEYKQFASWLYGAAAVIAHLRRYISGNMFGDKKNTITKILYKYAPPRENKTEQYINFVANRAGINRDAILDENNKEQMFKLVDSFIIFEDNKAYKEFNRALFDKAWNIALTQS
jgi:hypothetical protein